MIFGGWCQISCNKRLWKDKLLWNKKMLWVTVKVKVFFSVMIWMLDTQLRHIGNSREKEKKTHHKTVRITSNKLTSRFWKKERKIYKKPEQIDRKRWRIFYVGQKILLEWEVTGWDMKLNRQGLCRRWSGWAQRHGQMRHQFQVSSCPQETSVQPTLNSTDLYLPQICFHC